MCAWGRERKCICFYHSNENPWVPSWHFPFRDVDLRDDITLCNFSTRKQKPVYPSFCSALKLHFSSPDLLTSHFWDLSPEHQPQGTKSKSDGGESDLGDTFKQRISYRGVFNYVGWDPVWGAWLWLIDISVAPVGTGQMTPRYKTQPGDLTTPASPDLSERFNTPDYIKTPFLWGRAPYHEPLIFIVVITRLDIGPFIPQTDMSGVKMNICRAAFYRVWYITGGEASTSPRDLPTRRLRNRVRFVLAFWGIIDGSLDNSQMEHRVSIAPSFQTPLNVKL